MSDGVNGLNGLNLNSCFANFLRKFILQYIEVLYHIYITSPDHNPINLDL